jgi:hypothetical protein
VLFFPSISEVRSACVRRCIGAFLFLFVFTLPLHFHPATQNPQVSQECSCYYSGRTELGPPPAVVVLAPIYEVVFLVTRRAEAPAAIAVDSESPRGPPRSL